MSAIDYATAKTLVLADLRKTMMELPVAERSRPRYMIHMKPYSILDLIAAVERDDLDIRDWFYNRVKYMGYIVEG